MAALETGPGPAAGEHSGAKPSFDQSKAQKVTDKLFIGPIGSVGTVGEDAFVSCLWEAPPVPAGVTQLHVQVRDDGQRSLAKHFQGIFDFISTVEGTVLVHCSSGVSRSATAVIGTLVLGGQRLADAYAVTHAARPCILPSDALFKELQELEKAKHGNVSMTELDFHAYQLATVTQKPLATCKSALATAGGSVERAAAALF